MIELTLNEIRQSAKSSADAYRECPYEFAESTQWNIDNYLCLGGGTLEDYFFERLMNKLDICIVAKHR